MKHLSTLFAGWGLRGVWHLSLWLLLLSAARPGWAQSAPEPAPLISGSFTNASFEQFAQQIERQTKYRFYFEPVAVDSLCITLTVNQQPLPAVLDAVFGPGGLRYAIDADYHVYVTSGKALQTSISPVFFRQNAGQATLMEDDPLDELNQSRSKRDAAGRVYEIGQGTNASGKATVAGHVRDAANGEPAVGVSVAVEAAGVGAATDQFGYYSLTLPLGRHTIQVRGIGIKNTKRVITLNNDGKLEIEWKKT